MKILPKLPLPGQVIYPSWKIKRLLPGYIGDIKNLEIKALPKINDELETEISVENQIFEVTIIRGSVQCRKKLLAECEMKIFISQSK